ncbi:MAG: heavy metal translocating P-type ATPase [Candidatus Thiodiazotropha sp.]
MAKTSTDTQSVHRLVIEGMSCQHCVAAVTRAVSALPGVQEIHVDLQAGSAEVTGGEAQQLIDAIEEAGYPAHRLDDRTVQPSAADPETPHTGFARAPQTLSADYQLAVDDMTCASCVAAVERAIRSVSGVEQASVNLVEKRAQVVGGQAEAVAQAINDQGYRARLIVSRQAPDELHLRFDLPARNAADDYPPWRAVIEALDDAAEIVPEPQGWRIRTLQHPADLLIALEQSGYPAKLLEDLQDPYAEEALAAAREVRRSWLRALLAGIVGMGLMTAEMRGWIPAIGTPAGEQYGLAVAILCLFVMRYSGGHYYLGAWKQLRHRSSNMDTLIALGTGTAWLSSVVIVLQPEGAWLRADKLYFDASVMILAFLQFGHALEVRAKRVTSEAVGSLVGLTPKLARVVRGDAAVSVPVSLVQVGDRLRVLPGERVAVDGTVVEGGSHVDEAMLTGESRPVRKQPGDEVVGGSVNRNGSLLYEVTRVGEATTLAHIIGMVRQAQMSKPAIARLVDRISAVFVPLVVMVALATFLVWLMVAAEPALPFALTAAIAVLVIACPCALGLATPIAIMVGTSRAAQLNVLIRNSEGLQSASGLTHLVVDKTGTLTQGTPRVTAIYTQPDGSQQALLGLAASVEALSSHPLASAISAHASALTIETRPVTGFVSHDGLGVEAQVDGRRVCLGGAQYLNQRGITLSESWRQLAERETQQAGSLVWVLVEDQLSGLIVLSDPIRADSFTAVRALQKQGIEVVICTGDQALTAQAVAQRLGIGAVHSELLPADKLAIVRDLQARGFRVGMVGDGVNDAPALAQADTSFAIGSGTDVAIQHADITLVGDSLHNVSTAIAISRATLRNIRQNLFGAFIYNMIGIPLAAGLFYPVTGWLLPPMFASAAMALSSVTVVANANRLRFFKLIEEPPLSTTLKVIGMTCGHCVNHVTKALQAVPGVEAAEVKLEDGSAVVTGSAEPAALIQAVVDAGYSAEAAA